jgi:hypothetical protein
MRLPLTKKAVLNGRHLEEISKRPYLLSKAYFNASWRTTITLRAKENIQSWLEIKQDRVRPASARDKLPDAGWVMPLIFWT